MTTLGEDDFEALYRSESRKVLATLVRLLGDFDLAEESMQEAFTTAWDTWSEKGVPKNPASWLISTGRFKAIDMRLQGNAEFLDKASVDYRQGVAEPSFSRVLACPLATHLQAQTRQKRKRSKL